MECLINIFKKAYSICVWFKCLWLLFNYSLGDKALDGYSKKKYVCKLLFIFLLGHDIDFGHMEAVNLLSSNKYTEKQIVSNVSYLHSKISYLVLPAGLPWGTVFSNLACSDF